MKKILERIKKEKEQENEYNRTKVTEYQIKMYHEKKHIGPNEGNVLRIINKNDTSNRSSAYINKSKTRNQIRLQTCMGGMRKFNDLCFLQVKGMNQLQKELEETKAIKVKQFNFDAIHTNKDTGEVEGLDNYNMYHSETVPNSGENSPERKMRP